MAGEEDERPSGGHRTTGRLGRFARLSSMTAGVAARQLGTKVGGAFRSAEAQDEARRRALSDSANQIAETMGHLKGAAMKVGQLLSADPELLPTEVTDALGKLQSEAPPMDFAQVKSVVEQALDAPLEEVFPVFSEAPIGAASIGQVHRATTRDGQEVAVKVQYPGIVDTIESDMKNLGALLNLARTKMPKASIDAYQQELTEVILRESDYLNEADNLERFQVVLKDVEGARVPIPDHELTRQNVLVMEYVEGERLYDWLARAPEERREAVATQLILAYIEMIHRHGALHADPHPGNFLVDEDENIVFLDLGCVRDYPLSFCDDLIRVLVCMWKQDVDGLFERLTDMGHRTEGLDPDLVFDWLEMVLEPLLVDRAFDYGAWGVHEKAMRMMRDNPELMGFAPPREAVFYLRVLAGLRGLMGQTGVKLNAYRIARQAVEDMGLA